MIERGIITVEILRIEIVLHFAECITEITVLHGLTAPWKQ